jgi:hypothetical protein
MQIESKSMWNPILTVPYDLELELAVLDGEGEHALVFPCTKHLECWRNALTGERIDIDPTHWRVWHPSRSANGALPDARS